MVLCFHILKVQTLGYLVTEALIHKIKKNFVLCNSYIQTCWDTMIKNWQKFIAIMYCLTIEIT